jgi:hypothetical protein
MMNSLSNKSLLKMEFRIVIVRLSVEYRGRMLTAVKIAMKKNFSSL